MSNDDGLDGRESFGEGTSMGSKQPGKSTISLSTSSTNQESQWSEAEVDKIVTAFRDQYALTGLIPNLWPNIQNVHKDNGFDRSITAIKEIIQEKLISKGKNGETPGAESPSTNLRAEIPSLHNCTQGDFTRNNIDPSDDDTPLIHYAKRSRAAARI